jgi:hypothetical protein
MLQLYPTEADRSKEFDAIFGFIKALSKFQECLN